MKRFVIKEETPRVKTSKHWQFCIGSGQAKLALRSDYAKQLKYIHDELGIQRVRFHGIFDDSMETYMGLDSFMLLPGSKRFKNYNFRNIGIAYDNILAAGMQPWVELSFMPSRLAKGKRKVAVNASGKSTMPKDDNEWKDFIQAFIYYLLNRYGSEEVEQWFFEVWNEPDMFAFFSGSKEDYFHLYEITSRAIKEADPRLKVGGPATAEDKWIPEFIEYCEKNHIPLDFISTHNYPGDEIGEIFLGKMMLESIVGGMKNLKKMGSGNALDGCRAMMVDKSELSEYPKGQMYDHTRKVREMIGDKYPIYYSEWNCNGILTASSNDTRKVACFQTKSIDEMEPYVTGSSIWCFSDIFDEFLLLPDQFSGGFGLLTVDGIPKPQFHALKLLSKAGERKYVLPHTNDEIEIAVYESDTEKQIFVYRQRMKNVIEPALDYDVSIELLQKPEAVECFKIDKNHCNPFRKWKELGKPKDMNQKEIQEIVDEIRLVGEQIPVTYTEGKLELADKIGVNDVHCYVITH